MNYSALAIIAFSAVVNAESGARSITFRDPAGSPEDPAGSSATYACGMETVSQLPADGDKSLTYIDPETGLKFSLHYGVNANEPGSMAGTMFGKVSGERKDGSWIFSSKLVKFVQNVAEFVGPATKECENGHYAKVAFLDQETCFKDHFQILEAAKVDTCAYSMSLQGVCCGQIQGLSHEE